MASIHSGLLGGLLAYSEQSSSLTVSFPFLHLDWKMIFMVQTGSSGLLANLLNRLTATMDHETLTEALIDIASARGAKVLLKIECISHVNAEKIRGRMR